MATESGKPRKRRQKGKLFKRKRGDPAQSKRFMEAAKALGLDKAGSEDFEKTLREMLKQPKGKGRSGSS